MIILFTVTILSGNYDSLIGGLVVHECSKIALSETQRWADFGCKTKNEVILSKSILLNGRSKQEVRKSGVPLLTLGSLSMQRF